jgi:hypothetical protein
MTIERFRFDFHHRYCYLSSSLMRIWLVTSTLYLCMFDCLWQPISSQVLICLHTPRITLKPVFHFARIVPKRTGEHAQIEKRFINPRHFQLPGVFVWKPRRLRWTFYFCVSTFYFCVSTFYFSVSTFYFCVSTFYFFSTSYFCVSTFYFCVSTFYFCVSTFYFWVATFYFCVSTFYFCVSTFYFCVRFSFKIFVENHFCNLHKMFIDSFWNKFSGEHRPCCIAG